MSVKPSASISIPSTSGASSLRALRPLHGDQRPSARSRRSATPPAPGIRSADSPPAMCSTAAAPPVVVVTGSGSRPGSEVTPSSITMPSSLQHQAVAASPDRELGPGIGVDAPQEGGGIGAADLDLAQGGGVQHADRSRASRGIPAPPPAACSRPAREVPGRFHWPTSSNTAPCDTCPVVHRGLPHRLEQGSRRCRRAACRRSPGYRGAEGGLPDCGRAAQGPATIAMRVDVAELALVGGDARGRVALDVLDRPEAFAHRKLRYPRAVTSCWKSTNCFGARLAGFWCGM